MVLTKTICVTYFRPVIMQFQGDTVHWLSIHVCLLLSNQTFKKSEWDVVCNRSLIKP